MTALADRTHIVVYGPNGPVQLDSLVGKTMTTNVNGHEKVDFSFTWPAAADALPIDKNYGVAVVSPYLGGMVAWEGSVYDVSEPGPLTPDMQATYTGVAYGLQHDVKTEVPTATGHFTNAAPEIICADSTLLGFLNTMWGVAGQAAVVDATGNSINYTADVHLNKSIAEHWLAVLASGDGVTIWDWAIWCDPHFGLRPAAQRAQTHFQKRNVAGTPAYVVSRENLATNTTFTRSMDQVWSNAIFRHSTSGADATIAYSPPTLPPFPRYHVGGGSSALQHVYIGDLGLPTGGATPTSTQLAQLAAAIYNAELAYRYSSGPIAIMPDSILDGANPGTPVPNELIRAGRLLAIRNTSMRQRQSPDVNLFITQTSLDLQTGILTVTPQSSKDWHTNQAALKKRKGSARTHTTL